MTEFFGFFSFSGKITAFAAPLADRRGHACDRQPAHRHRHEPRLPHRRPPAPAAGEERSSSLALFRSAAVFDPGIDAGCVSASEAAGVAGSPAGVELAQCREHRVVA